MFEDWLTILRQHQFSQRTIVVQLRMLFSQLLFMLLICLERQAIAVEPDYLCQAAVIQECSDQSQGLLKALESGNEHLLMEECNLLQVHSKLSYSNLTIQRKRYYRIIFAAKYWICRKYTL